MSTTQGEAGEVNSKSRLKRLEAQSDTPEMDALVRELKRINAADWTIDLIAKGQELERRLTTPIPMVLHCPRCGMQHIDAPGEHREIRGGELCIDQWTNPPHRSHLCGNPDCGCIWRPADVCTVGVEKIETHGKNDTPLAEQRRKQQKAVYDHRNNLVGYEDA